MRSALTSMILRLGVAAVGHDPRLRAGQRDRLVAEVVDHHRRQRAGHALAGREQHVHLARVRPLRDLVRERHQLVGVLAARRQDGDHLAPSSARSTMRPAARLIRSASATEVPPNFMTTVSGMATKDSAVVSVAVCATTTTTLRLGCAACGCRHGSLCSSLRSLRSRRRPSGRCWGPRERRGGPAPRCPSGPAGRSSRPRSSRRSSPCAGADGRRQAGRRRRAASPTSCAGCRSSARWPSCSWSASAAPTRAPRSSGASRRLDLGGIVARPAELHRPRTAGRAHRRGARHRAAARPRAALGARRPGRRRVQRPAGPPAGERPGRPELGRARRAPRRPRPPRRCAASA